jgi:hypothetical protein
MNFWTDYSVRKEQYRDQLRRTEKQRLVKQVRVNGARLALGQAIDNLANKATKKSQSPNRKAPSREHSRLARKTA